MVKESKTIQLVGSWAFLIGMIIAIVAGFWDLNPIVTSLLIVLGLIVGFLNVTGRETTPFLLATVSLVIVADFGGKTLSEVSIVLARIFKTIVVFVVPATIIVALKAIYALASDE
jgi:hypothetical protein